jgi:hypothetical protein
MRRWLPSFLLSVAAGALVGSALAAGAPVEGADVPPLVTIACVLLGALLAITFLCLFARVKGPFVVVAGAIALLAIRMPDIGGAMLLLAPVLMILNRLLFAVRARER